METNSSRVPDTWRWVGIVLIMLVGLVHLAETPEYFEFATYLGVLFVANVIGSIVAAIGIFYRANWGWLLGVLVSASAFVGYVISRTVGLPGLPESATGWLEPLGVISLIVEGAFIAVYLATLGSTAFTRR